MHFLINELSFIGQCVDIYKADELMEIFFRIIQEISVIQNDDPIQTHSSFNSQKLSLDLTVMQWFIIKTKSRNFKQETIAKTLLRLISKGPFIDEQDLLNDCKCCYQNHDISSSSLTGAAKLKGILISLQNHPGFINENIEFEFQEGINPLENRSIKNLTEIQHARNICPRYQPSSKHDLLRYWQDAAPMDLTDEEAQKLLNVSVKNSNTNSNRRYGYHKEKDKFYVFHSENRLNEQGYPTYHGFPISENHNDIPDEIRGKKINST